MYMHMYAYNIRNYNSFIRSKFDNLFPLKYSINKRKLLEI